MCVRDFTCPYLTAGHHGIEFDGDFSRFSQWLLHVCGWWFGPCWLYNYFTNWGHVPSSFIHVCHQHGFLQTCSFLLLLLLLLSSLSHANMFTKEFHPCFLAVLRIQQRTCWVGSSRGAQSATTEPFRRRWVARTTSKGGDEKDEAEDEDNDDDNDGQNLTLTQTLMAVNFNPISWIVLFPKV